MKKARLPSSLGNSDVSQKESGYVFKEEQDAIEEECANVLGELASGQRLVQQQWNGLSTRDRYHRSVDLQVD